MDSLYEKINRWIPSKSDDTESRSQLIQLYKLGLATDFSPIFRQFGNRIQDLKYNFLQSVIASGAMCFFASLVMSICQLGYINNIGELFTFAACYILTDHYLDDNKILMEEKMNTIRQINKFIDTVSSTDNIISDNDITIDSPIIRVVAKNYEKMVTKIPNSEHHLREVFHAEVKTMYLQTHSELDRNTYLDICEWKGGLFSNAIQAILGLEITQAEYDLGSCIQLVDDIMDIEDDMSLGINTIATHDYHTYGNLDKLVLYMVNKVDKLDQKYTFFKPILYIGFTFAVHNNRDKYSNEMVELMENFIYFKPTTNKKNMIVWLKDNIVNDC